MMTLLADSLISLPDAQSGLFILIDSSIKGTVILIAALLTAKALRGSSATNRYLLWSCAIVSLLAIPLLSGIMPQWNLPVLPSPVSDKTSNTSIETDPDRNTPLDTAFSIMPDDSTLPIETVHQNDFISYANDDGDHHALNTQFLDAEALELLLAQMALSESVTDEPDVNTWPVGDLGEREIAPTPAISSSGFTLALPDWHWMTWVIMSWALGAAVSLLLLLAGLSRIRSLTKSALPLEGEKWTTQLRNVMREVGVDRPVRLLHCRQIRTPMTWGVINPVILLPTGCLRWSHNRRQVVLLHELVHIRRRDWVMQILSQIIGAAYWFNPLVWVALRHLSIERERACDDQVIGHGARPSDYASHLLEIARTLASGGNLTMASLGMAHHSQLEGRLLSILDPKRSRRGFGRLATLTAVIGMGAGILPLAAMSPWAESGPVFQPANGEDEWVTRVGDELQIRSDENFNMHWTEADVQYRVHINGEVVFDEDSIESISEDGVLKISVKKNGESRTIVVVGEDDGDYSLSVYVDGDKKKLSRKARRWVDGMIKKVAIQIREFEKDMDQLDLDMKQLDVDMAQLQVELRENLGDKLMANIKIEGLEGLKALKGLRGQAGHWTTDDGHVFVMPNIDIEGNVDLADLHEMLADLNIEVRGLQGDEGHVFVMPEIEIMGLEGLKGLEVLKGLHLKGGNWTSDDGHTIVIDGDFEGDFNFEGLHEDLEDMHFEFNFDGDDEDDHVIFFSKDGKHHRLDLDHLKGLDGLKGLHLKGIEGLNGLHRKGGNWTSKDGHTIVIDGDDFVGDFNFEGLHEDLEDMHFEFKFEDGDDQDGHVIILDKDRKHFRLDLEQLKGLEGLKGLHLEELKGLKGLHRKGRNWTSKDGHTIVIDGQGTFDFNFEGLHEGLKDMHFEFKSDDGDEQDGHVIFMDKDGNHRRFNLERLKELKNLHFEMPDMEKLHEQIQMHLKGQQLNLHGQRKHLRKQLEHRKHENLRFGDDEDHNILRFGDHDLVIDLDELKFDQHELHEMIQEMVQKHQGRIREFDFSQFENQWKAHQPEMQQWQEQLHKELGKLRHIEMPDMKELQAELAPMLEKLHKELPDLRHLQEKINNQLKPQLDRLQERLEVLKEGIEKAKDEVRGDVSELIADEVDSDDLSRGERKSLAKAIEAITNAFMDDCGGFNINDGVMSFNGSIKEIAGSLNDALDSISDDFDDEAIDRLEAALKSIASELRDAEFEISDSIREMIENFESGVDVDLRFGDDEDDDDDEDVDDDDNDDVWDNVAIAI
ncbi:MAG: hypothetical protein O7G85_08605 [Planctomycetota bacterium]|nr:hypothetical protein [Planctomycetota bacterium]